MPKTKEQLTRLTDKVEWCLIHYPETRNDDIELLRKLRQHFYKIDSFFITKDQMHQVPTQESVKRIRAKFNQHGQYYPTKLEVVKQRRLNQEVYHKHYASQW